MGFTSFPMYVCTIVRPCQRLCMSMRVLEQSASAPLSALGNSVVAGCDGYGNDDDDDDYVGMAKRLLFWWICQAQGAVKARKHSL